MICLKSCRARSCGILSLSLFERDFLFFWGRRSIRDHHDSRGMCPGSARITERIRLFCFQSKTKSQTDKITKNKKKKDKGSFSGKRGRKRNSNDQCCAINWPDPSVAKNFSLLVFFLCFFRKGSLCDSCASSFPFLIYSTDSRWIVCLLSQSFLNPASFLSQLTDLTWGLSLEKE